MFNRPVDNNDYFLSTMFVQSPLRLYSKKRNHTYYIVAVILFSVIVDTIW